MVSSGSGILPEYRGVTGTPRGSIGPTWALVERKEGRPLFLSPPEGIGRERERERERGVVLPSLVLFGLPMGEGHLPYVGCPLSPLWPMLAHYFPGGFQ